MRDVSIVIPSWNGGELLRRFFPSVLVAAKRYQEASGQKVEIVVVDDGSSDDSVDWLDKTYGNEALLRIIVRPHNGGFVRAANSGFAAVRHEIVFLLNNDVMVSPEAIAPLIHHFQDARVFAVCSWAGRINTNEVDGTAKLGRFKRGFWRVFENFEIRNETSRYSGKGLPSFYGSGAYTAYDAIKLSLLGGFNEILAPSYWEDVEICYRAWKRGWTVEYEPESKVYHLGTATMTKKNPKSKLKVLTERNRLLMTWIHLHDPLWFSSHFLWLGLKLLGATMVLDFRYWKSFLQALRRLPEVRRARRMEKVASVRSDREIAACF
jgi:GT2 family glycosyltransferase